QDEIAEGQVGEHLPVLDEQVQPLGVARLEAGGDPQEVRQCPHAVILTTCGQRATAQRVTDRRVRRATDSAATPGSLSWRIPASWLPTRSTASSWSRAHAAYRSWASAPSLSRTERVSVCRTAYRSSRSAARASESHRCSRGR